MRSFRYSLPATDLISGKGSLECLGTEVRKIGKKVLLVTGKKSMKRLGFLQKSCDSLKKEGLKVVHYGEVVPNPTVEVVDKGTERAIDSGCDVVVGLGGGSAMDTAKNIAIAAGHFEDEKISIWEFAGVHDKPRQITSKSLPVVAIASTSGSGSHVSRFAVVTNQKTREKTGIMSSFICPKLSMVDIDILSCMPPSLTSKTGFDALTHVMECFVSKRANPITDFTCLKAMKLIFDYLPPAYNRGGDMEAREAMALADTFAGWALVTSRPILPHALSHPVSAFYPEIGHGSALSALTPEIMRFNIERGDEQTVSKYCEIAKMGREKVASCSKKEALKSVKAVQELLEKIELNVTLKDLGVKEDSFEDMVESAFTTMKGPIEVNPVPLTREDMLNLYSKSM